MFCDWEEARMEEERTLDEVEWDLLLKQMPDLWLAHFAQFGSSLYPRPRSRRQGSTSSPGVVCPHKLIDDNLSHKIKKNATCRPKRSGNRCGVTLVSKVPPAPS